MTLYHVTDPNGANGIATSKSLWLTNLAHTDDSMDIPCVFNAIYRTIELVLYSTELRIKYKRIVDVFDNKYGCKEYSIGCGRQNEYCGVCKKGDSFRQKTEERLAGLMNTSYMFSNIYSFSLSANVNDGLLKRYTSLGCCPVVLAFNIDKLYELANTFQDGDISRLWLEKVIYSESIYRSEKVGSNIDIADWLEDILSGKEGLTWLADKSLSKIIHASFGKIKLSAGYRRDKDTGVGIGVSGVEIRQENILWRDDMEWRLLYSDPRVGMVLNCIDNSQILQAQYGVSNRKSCYAVIEGSGQTRKATELFNANAKIEDKAIIYFNDICPIESIYTDYPEKIKPSIEELNVKCNSLEKLLSNK